MRKKLPMEVLTDKEAILSRRFRNTAVTIGVFDGVHRGHVRVIRQLLEIADSQNLSEAIVVTFDRHPLSVTHPEIAPFLLTTLEEKLSIFSELGVRVSIVEHFDETIARMEYSDYISDMLVGHLGMKHLVIGYDFHLGRGRLGSRENLEIEGARAGFKVSVVPPVVLEGSAISSTKIRRDVSARKLSRAARFLGRNFFFEADVVPGDGIGRSIGFPTANLSIRDPSKLLPPSGVYAVLVDTPEGTFGGMMNIGSTPTVRSLGKRRIETHIFGFSGDLVGKEIKVHCISFMRDEMRFESCQSLKEQLLQDKQIALGILEKKR